jgi:hypothetical protein
MQAQATLDFDFTEDISNVHAITKPLKVSPVAQSTAMSLLSDCQVTEGTEHIFKQITCSEVANVESLLDDYDLIRASIIKTAKQMASVQSGAMHYLIEGNISQDYKSYVHGSTSQLTDHVKGISALDADFWSKAMKLTDVLQCMPANRKKEWNEQINSHSTPEFERESVIRTLVSLLNERSAFFSERVDNVFKSLSPDHVTNSPAAFTARFIMKNVFNHVNRGYEYWDVNHGKSDIIDDLRVLVAQISGRASLDVNHMGTYSLLSNVEKLRLFGQWHEMDGGAIRFKCFKVGTVHFEIHPDIAATLNNILSTLYPAAIPSRFKNKRTKACKTWPDPVDDALSIGVLSLLNDMRHHWRNKKESYFSGSGANPVNPNLPAAYDVLTFLGGVKTDGHGNHYRFDYDVEPVIKYLCITGKLPNKKSHQFYATPEQESEEAADLLNIEEGKRYLEPSAGQAHLAMHLPKDATLIDISPLQCKVLQAKGFKNTEIADFLVWAKDAKKKGIEFDGILMNPPYCQNQAKHHLLSATTLLAGDGAISAIVPSTLKDLIIEGFNVTSTAPKQVQFPDALVNVVILYITRIIH